MAYQVKKFNQEDIDAFNKIDSLDILNNRLKVAGDIGDINAIHAIAARINKLKPKLRLCPTTDVVQYKNKKK